MFELLFLALTVLTGYAVGSYLEAEHFKSLREREQALQNRVFTYSDRHVPADVPMGEVRLLAGSTVVSVDAFKRLAAKLHSIFGGRLTSYESLAERGRREAILRLREQADRLGATMVLGLRIETSAINDGDPSMSTGIELIAYGTAIIPHGARTGV